MAVRSHFVKADGLPPNFSDGNELFKIFNSVGEVVDILADSPTSIVVAYNRRAASEYAVFALNGQVTLQGNVIQVNLYVPATDPNYSTNPALHSIGANIGQPNFTYNPSNFVAFNLQPQPNTTPFLNLSYPSPLTNPPIPNLSYTTNPPMASAQPSFSSLPASGVQLPNYSFNPGNLRPSVLQPSVLQPSVLQPNSSTSGGASFVSNFSSSTFIPNGQPGSTFIPNGQPGSSFMPNGGAVTNGVNGVNGGATPMDVSSSTSSGRLKGQFGDFLSKHTKDYVPPSDASKDCLICMCELGTTATYDENTDRVLTLSLCGHGYHQTCLEQMMKTVTSEFLQCPQCKKVHGIKTGTMPPGQISHRLMRTRLPGYENCGTIEITFHFSTGLQGPEHPHPGQYYHCQGFPRIAYLPDCEAGVKMLHGVYIAWQQKVMFTVGRSITTGRDDCVTWNDIHMKTHMVAGEHGYPDPAYLTNLAQDLKNFGIMDAEISSHMANNPKLREQGRL